MEPTVHKANKQTNLPKVIGAVLVIIFIVIGSFVGGVQYQKSKGGNTASTTGRQGQFSGAAGRGGMMQNGGIGTVTAVSATSISLNEQRTGTTKTYTIGTSTTITDNDQTVAASDIKVDDRVLVRTSSATSTDATAITVNPSFGGGGPGGGTDQSATDTQTN